MANDLIIVGTSGQAKESAQLARSIDPNCVRWGRISFVTDGSMALGTTLPFGVVRYVDAEIMRMDMSVDVVIGIGHPRIRQRIAHQLSRNRSLTFPNLIHPNVEIDQQYVSIGRGNIIANGAILTCDITIGDFNLLNWNVTVGHDACLGSYNVVNPGSNISGGVHLGNMCLLGTGCQVLEGVHIANGTTIGAGGVVLRDILSENLVHVGIPARPIK